jgi:hypothetical protein
MGGPTIGIHILGRPLCFKERSNYIIWAYIKSLGKTYFKLWTRFNQIVPTSKSKFKFYIDMFHSSANLKSFQ